MNISPKNFLASQKSNFDSFLALQNTLCQGFEKILDLNIATWKGSLQEAAKHSEQAGQLNDVQDSFAFASRVVQPAAEQSVSYGKQFYDIVSAMQSELTRLHDERVEQARKELNDAVEIFAENAPVGSESAVAMLKSSLASANNAYESFSKLHRQVNDATAANVKAATEQAFANASGAKASEQKSAKTAK